MFNFKKGVLLFIIVSSISLFTSCKKDDNPLSPAEDHFEAIGMAVFDASGKQVLTILRGVTSDSLYGETGKRSDHFSVKFYNETEKLINAPSDDPDHKFTWKIDDTTIASIWQHEGEEGGFEFHIEGKKSGSTFIEFFIEHEGHADYRTGKIPLIIK